jgi:diadenylate cyclase
MLFVNWLRWQNVVDFIVLSLAFYLVLLWAKQTRALHLALLILGFHAAALWAGHFDLTITSWVFEGACLAVIGLLVLLFQAELQQSLLRLDSIAHFRFHAPAASIRTYDAIVAAMFEMAQSKIGALIVLTRKDPIANLVSNGIRIDAEVSQGLLEAIFRKDSPIHDGAVLIEGERIAFARLVLPLSGREDVPTEFGTRHRAALGLAEGSDALVLVASEERGQVVVIDRRDIHAMPDQASLRQALYILHPDRPAPIWTRVRRLLFANARYRLSAVALAGLIWGVSFLGGGTTVKTVIAPVEFANVPAGLYISAQPLNTVSVQLRGNSWVMNPVMSGLTAHVDLSGLGEGWHTIRLGAPDLKLPPGVTAERLSPQTISLRLTRSTARQDAGQPAFQPRLPTPPPTTVLNPLMSPEDRPSRQTSK